MVVLSAVNQSRHLLGQIPVSLYLPSVPSSGFSFGVTLETEHGHGHEHFYHFNLSSMGIMTLN